MAGSSPPLAGLQGEGRSPGIPDDALLHTGYRPSCYGCYGLSSSIRTVGVVTVAIGILASGLFARRIVVGPGLPDMTARLCRIEAFLCSLHFTFSLLPGPAASLCCLVQQRPGGQARRACDRQFRVRAAGAAEQSRQRRWSTGGASRSCRSILRRQVARSRPGMCSVGSKEDRAPDQLQSAASSD
jgi:hypothetical protein